MKDERALTDSVVRLMARLAELGVRPDGPPADPAVVQEALTHSSWACEHGGRHNERLEMLGDAVLGWLVAELLFDLCPNAGEGLLTRLRAALVGEEALARRGRELGLGELLALGRGEEQSGARTRPSLLADAFEAVVAALARSEGMETASRLVRAMFADEAARLAGGAPQLADFKSMLQERTQAQWKEAPRYRVVGSEGPDHARLFRVEVAVRGVVAGRGEGRTKKVAEQQAAQEALESRLSAFDVRPFDFAQDRLSEEPGTPGEEVLPEAESRMPNADESREPKAGEDA